MKTLATKELLSLNRPLARLPEMFVYKPNRVKALLNKLNKVEK